MKDLQLKKTLYSVNIITKSSPGKQILTVPGNEFNHRSIHYLHIIKDLKKEIKVQLAPNVIFLTLYWTHEQETLLQNRRTKG